MTLLTRILPGLDPDPSLPFPCPFPALSRTLPGPFPERPFPSPQALLTLLLVCDVIAVFGELFIDAEFPSCMYVLRDAIPCCDSGCIGAGDYSAAAAADAIQTILSLGKSVQARHSHLDSTGRIGCDSHKHDLAHKFHKFLFRVSLTVLVVFELELLGLIASLDRAFFRQPAPANPLYVLDLIVITVSLGLETVFRDLAMALIIVRLWRFVRIGHGIFASTHSVAKEKSDKLHAEIRALEEEYTRALNQAASLATTTRPTRLRPGAGGRGERSDRWNEGCRLTVLPRLASAPSSTSGSPSVTRPPPFRGRSASEASAATHDLQGAGGEKLADGVAAALSQRSNTPTSPVGAPAMRRPPAAAPLGAAHRALQLGPSSSAARTGMPGVGTGMGAGEAAAAERQAPPAAEPEPAEGAAAAESVELELDALDMST
ncbi:hypothetical protein EMIHUDRAFT_461000 [Emiliania huxleyi CCMP1516]|uniref:Hydrogen voltage-gated channel 1 n=2 Tax=Emiliania huxleyi TaxID=2903 RepID=A0A0D3L1D6_EMIH1|nr:hypothetical protein EMIHUDRAFT_461000 [Emiliania huxleyi CCMP1516]EOD41821.1 hypothetical protein EMIHUDRAFT_461000 [Emiliania huxleyi CCMP1516]|eukprot:XP_005794250.1 hypothetical protein EMIHUDRAFT_461000 [Emiliania huxleyi CCMP1516]